MSPKPIHIGVFIPRGAQTLDVSTVDVLGSMSKEYLSLIPFAPQDALDGAPSTMISYISSPALGAEIPLTAGMTIKATCTYEDEAVAPGKLDIVVVPGPDPSIDFHSDPAALKWLREQFETPGVDVLSVCSGIMLCGAAGILEGKMVSGPRGLQETLVKMFPGAKFVGSKYRWAQDGNLWSSGGVTNGNDLMAAYGLASDHWSETAARYGAMSVDVGDRPRVYEGAEE